MVRLFMLFCKFFANHYIFYIVGQAGLQEWFGLLGLLQVIRYMHVYLCMYHYMVLSYTLSMLAPSFFK